MNLDNVRGIHMDVPYKTGDIEHAAFVYMGEEDETHTYMLELDTVEDGTQRYRVDTDIGPALLEDAALMDDQFDASVEEADTYTDVELDELQTL